jgi:alpha-L-fucosidase
MNRITQAVKRRSFLKTVAGAGAVLTAGGGSPFAADASTAALPSARQLAWHELEVYGFLHFTVNTFTDKEWGYGDEDPNLFNPTQFDPDAIVEGLHAAGMKGVILTCKHHDGFCLWPTRTTEHCVRNIRWRDGKADVVKEIAEAARRRGLGFGVYLSPWDRNHATYAKPEYVQVYRQQLRELLTKYGPIFEVWHDGANGGDGYYGGAREKRTIDKLSYYGWPETWELVRQLQPKAVIFSDVGPDIRWVGNEKGYANETCWATYAPVGLDGGPPAPGHTRYREAGTGHRDAPIWMPAECDVSIRPGWFWHEKENAKVKTPEQLLDLYYRSVGHGASFLLNVPPDRRGLLHETDVASLAAFGRMVRETFAQNLAGKPKSGKAGAEMVVEVAGGRGASFNVVRLREQIRRGQRIDSFALDAWQNGDWKQVAEGTSVGSCRLVRLAAPVSTNRVRLRVTKFSAPPMISELGLFSANA